MPHRPLVPAPVARGTHGAVVAPHHLATAAGLAVLRAGGDAVDAAIATNAVLAVVMPGSCGLGGDAFWLIWEPSSGRLQGLNGSGRAPRGMDPDRLRAAGLDRVPLRGPLTITVPGAVRSWGDAHGRYGDLPMAEVLGPAIELADDGFPASDGFVGSVERTAPIVDTALGPRSGWQVMFRPAGRAWRAGERVRQPALAATLRRLAEVGTSDLYEGQLAVRAAAGLEAAGSPIRAEDLAAHTSTWTEPLRMAYRDIVSATHPPNSQGITALEILGLLDRATPPSPDAFGPDGARDPAWIHRGIEAAKLAMADRDAEVTDPASRDIPIERLLGQQHLDELAARIDPTRARRPPEATNPVGGGTIWLGVVDPNGMAVSLIQSNYMGFGSGVADPAIGIHYQNRGSYFSLDPRHPNVVAPGKRTLHTLMPAMLLRNGRPWVVTGSMGADAQPQIHAQVVSALVDGRVDVATAVGAPRWFVAPEAHFAPPMLVRAEPRFEPGVLEALERLGHPVAPTEPFDSQLGHAHAIELIDGGPSEGGSAVAATDPRSEGLPAAW